MWEPAGIKIELLAESINNVTKQHDRSVRHVNTQGYSKYQNNHGTASVPQASFREHAICSLGSPHCHLPSCLRDSRLARCFYAATSHAPNMVKEDTPPLTDCCSGSLNKTLRCGFGTRPHCHTSERFTNLIWLSYTPRPRLLPSQPQVRQLWNKLDILR